MAGIIFTVTRLNSYIRKLLEGDVLLESLSVQGELSNFKNHISGHWYFTLKDENASINCVMFRSAAQSVPFAPHNGLRVIVSGRVSLYEKTGAYQVYAEQMTPLGKGSLALAFEQLKAKLHAEGLFDAAHKRPIPAYPYCVAVITSTSGAALRDIIQIARRRNPKIEIVIIPALVQGKEAVDSIVSAFRIAKSWGKADVIILARGGGSQEDLWPFNEEQTARAVYASDIPVISAIGHETDYTISDFTADLRAPTPSAAAELSIPSYTHLLNSIRALQTALTRAAVRCVSSRYTLLNNQIKRNISERMLHAVSLRMIALEQLSSKQARAVFKHITEERRRVKALSDRLTALSPMNVLLRGYAAVMDENNRHIGSAGQLEPGQHIRLMFADGNVRAQIAEDSHKATEEIYAKKETNI